MMLFHLTHLAASDLINSLIEFFHDMEPIQNVQGMGDFLSNHPHVGFPHVGTNIAKAFASLLTQECEKRRKAFTTSAFCHIEQPFLLIVNLVDQSRIFMSLANRYLIYSNTGDAIQITTRPVPPRQQTLPHDKLNANWF